MKPEKVRYSGGQDPQPIDRLTRLADTGRKAMYDDPEWHQGDKLIISIAGPNDEGKMGGGLFVHGYGMNEDDEDEIRKEYPEWDSFSEKKREHLVRTAIAAQVVAVLMEHAESLLAEATGMPVKIIPVHPGGIDQVMPFMAPN